VAQVEVEEVIKAVKNQLQVQQILAVAVALVLLIVEQVNLVEVAL
jgi:hypothetical protein